MSVLLLLRLLLAAAKWRQ